jgi:hypothetical protein
MSPPFSYTFWTVYCILYFELVVDDPGQVPRVVPGGLAQVDEGGQEGGRQSYTKVKHFVCLFV